jgi:hypothetical protein
MSLLGLKCLFYSNGMVFLTLKLRKKCIGRISFRKFLGFPEYIPDRTPVWSFRKRAVKEHHLEIRDILRNKRIGSKRVPEK